MNDFTNMVSTLFHENKHKRNDDPEKLVYKYADHIKVYEEQFSDVSFSKTTKEFKTGMVNNYASYLSGALANGEINSTDLATKLNSFNNNEFNKKNGLSIYVDSMGEKGPRLFTTGSTNKDKKTDTYAAPKEESN